MNKFSHGQKNSFELNNRPFKIMQLGVVEIVGKLPINSTDKNIKAKDERFNSDPYIIRCRIIGGEYDNQIKNANELPNCFPLLSKLDSPIPKVGETVMLFMYDNEDKHSDRFYIGPIISNLTKLKKQTQIEGSTNSLSTATFTSVKDLSKIESFKGIYSEYDSNDTRAINGRDNADIVFKPSEILIRAGKFIKDKPEEFNQKNPGYFQIKHNFKYNSDDISVTNMVSNKINLITYNGIDSYNLTYRDLKNNTTPYINDEELKKIIDEAHPLPYGDLLLEYLIAFRKAFDAHIHNHFGATPPTDNKTVSDAVKNFRTIAPNLETKMLSKNIKIN